MLVARRADRLAGIAREIGALALAIPLDLRNGEAVDGLLGRLPPKFRAIDILVNNAGHDVGGKRPFIAGPADAWADIVETNLQSLLRVTRAVLPGTLLNVVAATS